jgi:hypothetical protein
MSDSTPAERPTLNQDVYVFADEDLSRLVGEVYVELRSLPAFDDDDAEEAAELTYQMPTGGWDYE